MLAPLALFSAAPEATAEEPAPTAICFLAGRRVWLSSSSANAARRHVFCATNQLSQCEQSSKVNMKLSWTESGNEASAKTCGCTQERTRTMGTASTMKPQQNINAAEPGAAAGRAPDAASSRCATRRQKEQSGLSRRRMRYRHQAESTEQQRHSQHHGIKHTRTDIHPACSGEQQDQFAGPWIKLARQPQITPNGAAKQQS